MRISELQHPWMRTTALGLSCFAGVSASALGLLAALAVQQQIWPSAELTLTDLRAAPGSAPWVESWALLFFWLAFGFAALFAGFLVGSALYEWMSRRYGLRRRKDGP